MITSASESIDYQQRFTNGRGEALSDTTPDNGGSGQGFRPHELLEAALANCMAITMRMFAKNHALPLEAVRVTVELDRSQPDKAVFEYAIDLQGDLSDKDRKRILSAVRACPVHKTLTGEISFRDKGGAPGA